MARSRSEKLKRLVEVQRHVEHLAEADLIQTNRERQRVRGAIEETVEAMGSLSDTHLMFSGVYARRIASLTLKEQSLEGLAGVQERRVHAEHAKGDRLERHLKAARQDEEREQSDEALYDQLDRLGAGDSSLR